MGFYINPKDCSKEEFLELYGNPATTAVIKQFDFSNDLLPVCLVDNGLFTAAGIAYAPAERDVFIRDDGRHKRWYLVNKKDLEPFYK